MPVYFIKLRNMKESYDKFMGYYVGSYTNNAMNAICVYFKTDDKDLALSLLQDAINYFDEQTDGFLSSDINFSPQFEKVNGFYIVYTTMVTQN